MLFLAVTLAYECGEVAVVLILCDVLPRCAGLALVMFTNVLLITLLSVLISVIWYSVIYAFWLGGLLIPVMQFLLGDMFGPTFLILIMVWVYIALPVGLFLFAFRLLVDIVLYACMVNTSWSLFDLHHAAELDGHP